MIGFTPEVDPASSDQALRGLQAKLIPLVIAVGGAGLWQIARRRVSLGDNGFGDTSIWIETPLSATQSGLTLLDPLDFK